MFKRHCITGLILLVGIYLFYNAISAGRNYRASTVPLSPSEIPVQNEVFGWLMWAVLATGTIFALWGLARILNVNVFRRLPIESIEARNPTLVEDVDDEMLAQWHETERQFGRIRVPPF